MQKILELLTVSIKVEANIKGVKGGDWLVRMGILLLFKDALRELGLLSFDL
jgi:hypothetical protein